MPLRFPVSLAAAALLVSAIAAPAQDAGGKDTKAAAATATAAPSAPAAAAPAPPEVNAAADAQVDGMLFFASNDETVPAGESPVQIDPAALTAITGRLGKVFPYKHFHLIGKHRQKVFKEYESWVVPSKDLCLKIDSRGPADKGGVNVHLQLWQDKKVLVKSDTTITPGRPIFLGGPDWRKGRLVFVVMLKQ